MSVVPMDVERAGQTDPPAADGGPGGTIAARSLGQAVWLRLRRDRTALVSGVG